MVLSRRGENEERASADGCGHIRFEMERFRQLYAGEKTVVAPGAFHFGKIIREWSPESDIVVIP